MFNEKELSLLKEYSKVLLPFAKGLDMSRVKKVIVRDLLMILKTLGFASSL